MESDKVVYLQERIARINEQIERLKEFRDLLEQELETRKRPVLMELPWKIELPENQAIYMVITKKKDKNYILYLSEKGEVLQNVALFDYLDLKWTRTQLKDLPEEVKAKLNSLLEGNNE